MWEFKGTQKLEWNTNVSSEPDGISGITDFQCNQPILRCSGVTVFVSCPINELQRVHLASDQNVPISKDVRASVCWVWITLTDRTIV